MSVLKVFLFFIPCLIVYYFLTSQLFLVFTLGALCGYIISYLSKTLFSEAKLNSVDGINENSSAAENGASPTLPSKRSGEEIPQKRTTPKVQESSLETTKNILILESKNAAGFLKDLPEVIDDVNYGKKQTVSLFCELFAGVFDEETVRAVSLRVIQEVYNSSYKHFEQAIADPIEFRKFLKDLSSSYQAGAAVTPETEKEKINRYIKILKLRRDCSDVAAGERSIVPSEVIDLKCLVEFYQQGLKLEELTLIFDRPIPWLRGRLVSKGVYVKESFSSAGSSTSERHQINELIFNICGILDLEHHQFDGLRDLGKNNLAALEKILNYRN